MKRLLRRLFERPLTTIDLRGAAEMANGIEKYGGNYAYMMHLFLEAESKSPRSNCIITGIGS